MKKWKCDQIYANITSNYSVPGVLLIVTQRSTWVLRNQEKKAFKKDTEIMLGNQTVKWQKREVDSMRILWSGVDLYV